MSLVECFFGKRKTLRKVCNQYTRALDKAIVALKQELAATELEQAKNQTDALKQARIGNLERVRTLSQMMTRKEKRIRKLMETIETLRATRNTFGNAKTFQVLYDSFRAIAVVLADVNRTCGSSGIAEVLYSLKQEHAMATTVEELLTSTATHDFDGINAADKTTENAIFERTCKAAASQPAFTIDDDGDVLKRLETIRAPRSPPGA
jgi:hypothetical protein